MSLVDQVAARMMQVVMARLLRPSAALLIAGADLPAPREQVVDTAAGPVRIQVYRPAATPTTPPPVYVNFHGGGFIFGHPEYDDHICRALVAGTGCVVLNVDYDIAPQRPFPAAVRQAYAITSWAVEHAAEQGWDGARLAVGGQSAGGNLAAGVCLQARDRGTFAPVLQVLNYPPLDLATSPADKPVRTARPLINPRVAKIFDNAYAPDPQTRSDPLVSPLRAPDVAGLPPALVITAEFDLLRDEGEAYAQRLADAGVPVARHRMPGVDHAFTHTEPVDPARTALTLMTEALSAAWAR